MLLNIILVFEASFIAYFLIYEFVGEWLVSQ